MNKKLKKEELEAANAAFKAYWANIEEQQKNNNLK